MEDPSRRPVSLFPIFFYLLLCFLCVLLFSGCCFFEWWLPLFFSCFVLFFNSGFLRFCTGLCFGCFCVQFCLGLVAFSWFAVVFYWCWCFSLCVCGRFLRRWVVSSYENLLDSTVMCKIYGWRRKWGFGGFFPQHNGRRHGNSRIVCVCAPRDTHTKLLF